MMDGEKHVTGEFKGGGGGGGSNHRRGGGGSSPPPGGGSGPTQVPHKHRLQFHKGFKKKTVHGMTRCVKTKKTHGQKARLG